MSEHPPDQPSVRMRSARASDAAALLAIYAPVVRDTAISFELEPPDEAEMVRRLAAVQGRYPWLVLERAGALAGYAYASSFRERPAYRWTAEVSVYVHAEHRRRGVARALYGELLARLRAQGLRTAVAVITLPDAGSATMHERLGFAPAGRIARAGYKFDRWYDIGFWQLALGGDGAPASPRPPRADAERP
ncbi:GNAT family N-acetyltransferase [Haliangium ochraceum]|uniref:Phosphinothricin acetyltransferase n=1 Tax=Haliangium ochraceum (strain DSM 14365 / JCM 11303 / SMP-2) TaxID=502025 RepID=D0LNJ4_HALO1|nr:GNAT family N-acetyltransferase [Haliangium ochraceum]ACY16899.1 Phosphinothricin acetyltransferase [Haliangium ochraceum DSM 14365]